MLANMSASVERTITFKHNSKLNAPNNWKIKTIGNYTHASAPENDLSIFLFEMPVTKPIEQMIMDAWQQIQPGFDLKPATVSNPPQTGNWKKCTHIVYDTPSRESRYLSAIARTFEGFVYISLIDATFAGLSRRVADLMLITDSWKPNGYIETDLSKNEAKVWKPSELEDFENFVQKAMEYGQIPGLCIGIVRNDMKASYLKAFGVKLLHSKDPVTIDTPFMIGSTTKSFTTLLMGMLIDRQKMTWDTPVTQVLKDFRLGDEKLTSELTMQLTVSASTGMPRRDIDFIFNYSDMTPEKRLAQIRQMKPTTGLGETFQYSNLLFMAGGYAAARAYFPHGNLEVAYTQAMQELVFDPLKMHSTTLKPQTAVIKGAAMPHAIGFGGKMGEIALKMEEACSSVAPAGAMWSTVNDLSHYILLELNQGYFDGNRLISEQALLARRKPGISIGPKSSYGLGLMMTDEQGLNCVSHGGGTVGFSSELFFIPEKGIGMILLANNHYAHAFLGAIKQKFMEITFSAKVTSDEVLAIALQQQTQLHKQNFEKISLAPKDCAWMANLLGEYENADLGNAKLTYSPQKNEYSLECKEWTSRLGAEITKYGKQILVLIDPPSCGTFKFVVEGGGSQLVLDGGQEKYTFTRYIGLRKRPQEIDEDNKLKKIVRP